MAIFDGIVVNNTTYDLRDANAVRFNEAQTLTDAQKMAARDNIGSASQADVTDLKSALDKTESNIDAYLVHSNVLYKQASFSVGEAGQTYQQKVFYTLNKTFAVGDSYTFECDTIVGNTTTPIRFKVMNGTTQIRTGVNSNANPTFVQVVIDSDDITSGVDSIIFFVYASTTTAQTQTCVLTNPVVYEGLTYSEQIAYTDQFKKEVDDLLSAPLQLIQAGSIHPSVVWENGQIDNTTGQDKVGNYNRRTKGYIDIGNYKFVASLVKPSSASLNMYLCEYDTSKAYLGRTTRSTTGDLEPQNSQCRFVRVFTYSESVAQGEQESYVTLTVINQESLHDINEQINDIKDTAANKLDNPFFVYNEGFELGSSANPTNTDPTRARLKSPLYGIGTLSIKNAESNGYRIALRTWTDEPYGTLDNDTGWITTDDFTYDVTGKYFNIGFSLLPNGTSNIDITALNASSIKITEMSEDDSNIVVVISKSVSTLQSEVPELIKNYETKSITFRSIAHRGDDIIAPQCTAPSYIIAKKNGFMVAENDLWLSEDGYFVMFHDGTLAKLGDLVDINGYLMYTDGTNYYWVNPDSNAVYTWNGSSYVASEVSLSSLTRCAGANYGVNSSQAQIGLNLDVLKRIDFGLYKGTQFKGTQILTFEEWVMLCKQLGMEIYVDKKMEYTTELLTSAANIVKKCGMGKFASWLGIYDISQIELLRSIIPDARIGILQHPTQNWIDTYKSYNTGRGFFFNGDAKTNMTAAAIQLGLNAGFDVEVWFVDVPTYTAEQVYAVIKNAISYGVTGMTLDHYRIEDAYASLLAQY